MRVIKNTECLILLKKRLGVDYPKVIVDFLESDINKHETQKFIKKWEGLADSVCISKVHDWATRKKGLADFSYQNYVSFSQTPCRLPFTEMLVNWDGIVSLCCQDIEGEVVVGDVKKQTLSQIWQGEKINQIRGKHLELKTENLVLCKDCKLRTFWWAF